MSNRLENFIRDHREEFDDEIPSAAIWDKIGNQIPRPDSKKGILVPLKSILRVVAIAAILLIAIGLWWFKQSNTPVDRVNQPTVAATNPNQQNLQHADPAEGTSSSPIQNDNPEKTANIHNPVKSDSSKEDGNDQNEELYHFAKLVEIKHRQLKQMSKDEPLLYQQFANDINKLDSVYHSLESNLSAHQNSEELLEAMIQNLQLQMQLLNRQLNIIHQLNHSKKIAYEKAYKSV